MSDYRAPRPAQKAHRRGTTLPAVAAVLALAMVGFFLSPAWAALQPGGDDPGAAEAGTDLGDETPEPTASTTQPTDTTDTTETSDTTDTSDTTTTDTSDTSDTTDPVTDTTDPVTDTSDTTETTDTTAPPTAEVPNVSGLTVDQADEALVLEGFTDQVIVEEASGTVAEGLVIGTDPSSGTVAELTTTITVLVSTGPELVAVPAVVGLETAAARAIVEGLGLVVAIERVSVAEDSPQAGEVIAVAPAVGEQVPVGSTVTLQVGQAPLPPVTVPPVIGPPAQITTTTLVFTGP